MAIFAGADAPAIKAEPGTAEFESAAMKAPGERIPMKYNVNTTLTAQVKAEGENVFKFDLSTKK